MANYNTTNITNANTPAETLTAISKVSDAVPIAMLALFFAVPFILTYRRTRSISSALNLGGFAATIVSALQWGAGLLAWELAVIPLPLFVFGMILAYWN